jgi:hypothetical protein
MALSDDSAELPPIKFVPHGAVEDHLRLGWQPCGIDGGLVGTPHGEWSIMMEWICRCPLKNPPISSSNALPFARKTHTSLNSASPGRIIASTD